jgi:salicylate hydroxylase
MNIPSASSALYSKNNNNSNSESNKRWVGCKYCNSTGEKYRHSVFVPCRVCKGLGIVIPESSCISFTPSQAPLVGIVGGGISGMALGLSLQHRNIPCIIFEKDSSFNSRCQGYGLTMQQGGRILQKMGIDDFQQYGATTVKHISFLPDGLVLGSYADKEKRLAKKQKVSNAKNTPRKGKRFNVMLPRQKLRRIIYEKISEKSVKWGHKFVKYERKKKSNKIELTFECNLHESKQIKSNSTVTIEVDVLVGADGIWSKVRRQSMLPSKYLMPRYLGVMVILGRARTK